MDFPGFRCCGGHELRPPETNCQLQIPLEELIQQTTVSSHLFTTTPHKTDIIYAQNGGFHVETYI